MIGGKRFVKCEGDPCVLTTVIHGWLLLNGGERNYDIGKDV